MKFPIRALIAPILLTSAVIIGGCQSAPQYEGVTFVEPTHDISSAFFDRDGSLYVVPEKGVLVDGVYAEDGRVVNWGTSGAYLVILKSEVEGLDSVTFIIEGRKRKMSFDVRNAPR